MDDTSIQKRPAKLLRGVLLLLLTAAYYTSFTQVLEAESGSLSGTQISTQTPGYSGSGYVTGFDAADDRVTMKITARAGYYNLFVRYASPFGEKFNFVFLNGENLGSVPFPLSTSFTETRIGKVYLQEGSQDFAIVKDWGYFDVDNIRLEAATPSPINSVYEHLVTPLPSPKTDSVYQFLASIYGKVILSGQYGGDTEFNRIRNVSGKTPAVRGFDMMDYSPSREARGATSVETEKAIAWSNERGMVTFCWHWNAPTDLIDQPGKEWWRGFYSDATTFDLSEAMSDASSEAYALILRDIDAIAIQLQKLEDADVPVLWRPLHEAEGQWFWWGAKGPEACKWLWRLMFDRLVNYHELGNLIWVWTSTGNPDALNWYPGDEYVDMLGADIYLPAGTYSTSFITFDNMAGLYGGRKMIALSENGPIPDPDRLFVEGVAWSWFSTWSGNFITDGVMNSEAHITKVFNHDYVITLDEIDDIDEIVALLEERKQQAGEEPVTRIEEEDEISISFINPIHGDQLVLQTGMPARVLVYDLHGRIIASDADTIGNTRMEFDFAHNPAGMYVVKVVTRQSVKVYRVLKINN